MDKQKELIELFGQDYNNVNNLVEYLNKKYPDKNIIIAGVSMGASSLLMSLKNIKEHMKVKCVISDCAYTNPYEEILYCINHYFHINGKLFITMINFWCSLIAKFNLLEKNTISCIKKSNIPILFIHGLDDDFVLPENSIKNYESYNGPKELLLFENANHGISYLIDSKKYMNKVKSFIKKYNN